MSLIFQSIPDGNVMYTGKDRPDLGIKNGDTADLVFDTLLGKVEGLLKSTPSTGLSSKSIAADSALFGLGGESVAAAQITERSLTYATATRADGLTAVSYDMTQTKNALPSGYQGLSSRVTSVDNTGERFQTTGDIGVLTIKNFPVTVDFLFGVRTPQGDVELNKRVSLISNSEVTMNTNFAVKDFTSTTSGEDMTQKQVNETLAATIAEMQRDVATLKSLNLPTEISSLKAQVSS